MSADTAAPSSAAPYESMPPLSQLLKELDPVSPRIWTEVCETLSEYRDIFFKWKYVHIAAAAALIIYGVFIFEYYPDRFAHSVKLMGSTLFLADVMSMYIWSVFRVYAGFSKSHITQIEGEMQRESVLIDRLRHLPPEALHQTRKRLGVEIDFKERAKFAGIGTAIFAFLSGLGAHAYQLGSAEWWAQTSNVILISAPAGILFFTGVMVRLTRKYLRLVHVLECAEEHYLASAQRAREEA